MSVEIGAMLPEQTARCDIDVARWDKREFAILREAIQATLQNNAQDLRLMRA